MNKTACIYHSIDLDGWMSAAIVKMFFTELNNENNTTNEQINIKNEYLHESVPILYSHNELNFIGYNYGQSIPDLSEYDKVITCDISFPKEEMLKLYERLNSNFIWIDHHISAIKDNVLFNLEKGGNYPIDYYGIRDIEFAACELTWKYFFPSETMPEIVRLLGRYDCFGHKGTDEEQKVLEFQYGARQCISNYEEAYRELCDNIYCENTELAILNKGKAIYSYLCTEAKQSYKNGFEIGFNNPYYNPHGIKGNLFTIEDQKYLRFICINKERFNPINFGIDYHKDGYDGCACFHYDGKQYNFSLYNDNGLVDVSVIAKQFGGGGHKGASGFILDNIEDFISKYQYKTI